MRENIFIIEACNLVNRYISEQPFFTEFRYTPETIYEYPFMMAVAKLLEDLDTDFKELTYDELKAKYMVEHNKDPVREILIKYIEDDDLLDKALQDIDNFFEPHFTITDKDIETAAKALCAAEGSTWWTEETSNIETMNNQRWIEKAKIVFQCLVDR